MTRTLVSAADDPSETYAFRYWWRKLIVHPYSTGPTRSGRIVRLRALETRPKTRVESARLRKSFVSRRIRYTCTAPAPPLDLLRRDLTPRIFDIWPLYESGTA